jgi:peroxiredoxin
MKMVHLRRLLILSVFAALAAMTGCPRESPQGSGTPATPGEPAAQAPKHAKKAHHAAAPMKPEPPPPPPTIPKVELSEEMRSTRLVDVGDAVPKGELPDLAGKLHSLSSLYGQKLTVLCFWTAGSTRRAQMEATEGLQDLLSDVAEPFGTKGVAVVAINVGDPADQVKKQLAEAGVTFPNLLDAKGEMFAKIATVRKFMPRTYLLDAGGRILWYDMEHSRATERDLVLGIRVALGELK